MDAVQEQFAGWLAGHGWTLTERQREQFERYFHILVEWNEKMNLTGITERDKVYEKHFYDSLLLAGHVKMEDVATMADIGSGAGFPGIPLQILFPHVQLTIVDSLNKRIQFLNHLVQELGLIGVECIHGRAEEVARKPQYRDRFDLVTARAVARLNVLNEFCLPFVKTGGLFAAMKGTNPAKEIAEAAKSLQVLHGSFLADHKLTLPEEQSERHIILIAKKGPTPKAYPRKPGMPLKAPIQ